MKYTRLISAGCFVFISLSLILAQGGPIRIEALPYQLYPDVNNSDPGLPSPFFSADGREFIVALTNKCKYAIVPVTLSNEARMCQQLIIDSVDFPTLAKTGLHSDRELFQTTHITGRSIEKITALGRPNGLSQAGFMAEDETIISVILADNQIVRNMGLTHPQLARPLFHLLNLMDADFALKRWDLADHRWNHIDHVLYNGQKIFVEAEDTKGGQKSIFEDGIEGAFYIQIWRDLSSEEQDYLKEKYGHLSEPEFQLMTALLSRLNTGEMQPQYIMRYGFYEGHTFWRVDPIALSFIFGLRTLSEIEKQFEGRLFETLTHHFTE